MTAQIEATEPLGMNRRDFLTSTAAVGGALVLGFHLPATSANGGRGSARAPSPCCGHDVEGARL